jgi:hypothetical protein
MAGATTERVMAGLTLDNLHHHRIIRVPERRITRLKIYLLNISNNGMMTEYRVRIGEFLIYSKVLNICFKTIVEGQNIDKGTFSTILKKSVAM